MAMSQEAVQALIDENNKLRDDQMRMFLEASRADKLLARKLKIDTEKAKYEKPQDKRAVGFLMDSKYDVEDLMENIRGLFNEEGALLGDNTAAKDKALEFLAGWGDMRNKKLSKEREAYEIANRSRYGWLTEKFFRQEEIFKKEGDEWWKAEEATPAEKVTRLYKAENKARLSLIDQKNSDKRKSQIGGNFRPNEKRSRWGPAVGSGYPGASSQVASDLPSTPGTSAWPAAGGFVNYIPSASFLPPRAPPTCYKCKEVGHIQKDCKK